MFESPEGARLSKVLAAIGPNASGKTNVLKPLAFLRWFVAHSFAASKPEDEIPVQAHFFSDQGDSEFEIEFENRGRHYRYSLIVNPERVVHESLHLKTSDVFGATEFFHSRPALRAQMSKILSRLDLGLAEVIIESHKFVEKKSGKSEEADIPFGVHRRGKRERKLPFWYESSGTQAAFVLLEKILPALEHGGIVIIDEMEADLHPDMITAMLDLFIDRERNPHNAQIIFTCHAHEVLNDLQKDQVLLIEKDPDGISEAWRLGDMRGVRRDDNLYAKYRAGAYGAVPDI